MKVLKTIALMLIIFALMGCSAAKVKTTASTTNAETQTSKSQASTPQGQAASADPTSLTTVSLKWIGLDKDQLSPNDLKTDGQPDGHFHLTVPFNQSSAVKSIWIRYSEFGKSFKWGWIYNKNLSIDGYKMAVFDSLGNQILPQNDNGYRVDGLADFDLYISELNNENGRDTFKFEKNQTFNLELDYVTQDNQVGRYTTSVQLVDFNK
ncbi:hypothetical protein [Desulfosporosinus sp. FKB]|uniref:hypothetical protein n=1 Tax=Desulfosporosinus sp. FKB TaxID=1969835 RepID=UPI000B49B480|nr:hypothetical protein [Desulfosporosinus sp. FKB]